MALHKIKRGLDLPITGQPEQRIEQAAAPARVALMAADYVGMKPTMHVAEGDNVRRGQLLFEDKKTPGLRFTAPGSGKVVGVNRGHRRALQSVVIELTPEDRAGAADAVRFSSYTGKHPRELRAEDVRGLLLESGLWTALRARPFCRVADPEQQPSSVFVTATDSEPLSADPSAVLAGREDDFERGLHALGHLTSGTVYVCARPGSGLQVPQGGRFRLEEFAGKHPSGSVGLHMHLLDPVHREKTVWYLGYQDVLAIGKLFASGELDFTRVVALAGPGVRQPRLMRTRLGAAVDDVVSGELHEGEMRVISGSVLAGRKAQGSELGYLGRYHQQISVLAEDRERAFLGWMGPGFKQYSTINAFAAKLLPGRRFDLTTSTQGSHRAIVPIGMYERVFPMDIPPTALLRALVMRDVEQAEALGCLELDEEDLALCSFVCPGKYEYGTMLRDVLDIIEKEG